VSLHLPEGGPAAVAWRALDVGALLDLVPTAAGECRAPLWRPGVVAVAPGPLTADR